MPKIKNIGF